MWQRAQAEAATAAEAALQICWENWPSSRAVAATFLLLFCACGQQLHVHVLLSDLIYRYVIDWCLAQQMHAGAGDHFEHCTHVSMSWAIVGTFCYRLVIEAVISCE